MSFQARLRRSVIRLTRHFGDGMTIVIRKANKLFNPATDDNVTALLLNGAVTVGDTTVGLKATALDGKVSPGITFTILGDATTYTITNEVSASSNALASVAVTPSIQANAANNTAVTIASKVDYTAFSSFASIPDGVLLGTVIHKEDKKLVISSNGVDYAPTHEDVLIIDGVGHNVLHVSSISPGEGFTGWVVFAGNRITRMPVGVG